MIKDTAVLAGIHVLANIFRVLSDIAIQHMIGIVGKVTGLDL